MNNLDNHDRSMTKEEVTACTLELMRRMETAVKFSQVSTESRDIFFNRFAELACNARVLNNRAAHFHTPLTKAVVLRNLFILRWLLSREAIIVDLPNKNSQTALEVAMRLQTLRTIQLLLENGARVTSNVLRDSVLFENVPLVKMLLQHIATAMPSRDIGEITREASITALFLGNTDIIYAFHNSGLVNMLTELARRELFDILKFFPWINVSAELDRSERGLMKMLIDGGIDVDERDRCGRRALVCACASNARRIEPIQILIEAGADVNLTGYADCVTPLFACSNVNHLEGVKLLVGAGADVNLGNSDGRTPLMCSMHWQYPNYEMTRLLLSAGANVNSKNVNGKTALMCVVRENHQIRDIVKILIEKGADVNARDSDGHTALMTVVHKPNLEIANMLLAAGADAGARDENRKSVLAHAYKGDMKDKIRALTKKRKRK